MRENNITTVYVAAVGIKLNLKASSMMIYCLHMFFLIDILSWDTDAHFLWAVCGFI